MKLRPYQRDGIEQTIGAFESGESRVLLCAPTGCGKTVMASDICKRFQPVAWVAHRRELLEQAAKALTDIDFVTISAHATNIPDRKFGLVVLDECHHEACVTYKNLIERIKFDKLLGITATPSRLDRMALRFNKLIEITNYGVLVNDGFLAKARLFRVRTEEDTLRDLSEWAKYYRYYIGPTIFFVRSIKEAERVKVALGDAEVICANSDRSMQLERFRARRVQFLISCLVLTEGVDLPMCQTVILGRETDSKTLLNQMIGRAVRPDDGKSYCNIVEPAQVFDSHSKVAVSSIITPSEQFISYRGSILESVFETARI